MLNKLRSTVFICLIIGAVIWIFSSGVLERFRTIEAQCVIAGIGNVSIEHQYTNSAEKSILVVNDQHTIKLAINRTNSLLNMQGPEVQGKLNLETKALFMTLGNKSYSGKCVIKQFSM